MDKRTWKYKDRHRLKLTEKEFKRSDKDRYWYYEELESGELVANRWKKLKNRCWKSCERVWFKAVGEDMGDSILEMGMMCGVYRVSMKKTIRVAVYYKLGWFYKMELFPRREDVVWPCMVWLGWSGEKWRVYGVLNGSNVTKDMVLEEEERCKQLWECEDGEWNWKKKELECEVGEECVCEYDEGVHNIYDLYREWVFRRNRVRWLKECEQRSRMLKNLRK